MHIHTVTEEVTLVSLLHYLEAKTGRKSKKPPQFAKTGQQIIALIETTAPVCMEKFADFPQLGRFTLRDEGKTIAIGKARFSRCPAYVSLRSSLKSVFRLWFLRSPRSSLPGRLLRPTLRRFPTSEVWPSTVPLPKLGAANGGRSLFFSERDEYGLCLIRKFEKMRDTWSHRYSSLIVRTEIDQVGC
jgi:hypothetical protein